MNLLHILRAGLILLCFGLNMAPAMAMPNTTDLCSSNYIYPFHYAPLLETAQRLPPIQSPVANEALTLQSPVTQMLLFSSLTSLLGLAAAFYRLHKTKPTRSLPMNTDKTVTAISDLEADAVQDCPLDKIPDATVVHAELSPITANFTESCGWLEPDALLNSLQLSPVDPKTASVTSLIAARHENQDYAITFQMIRGRTKLTIMAVADGLGGHPGGRAASFLACKGIAEAAMASKTGDPDSLLAELRRGAEQAVSAFASRTPPETCLTTAIIAVISKDRYHLTWLGDGGALIRRQTGNWMSVMIPQRGATGALNDVGGALAAFRFGNWSVAEERRQPGDLFMIGSDGVTERISDPEAFFQTPWSHVTQGVALQSAMTDWLTWCSQEDPSSFDDNMSLVTLMTPAIANPRKAHSQPAIRSTAVSINPLSA